MFWNQMTAAEYRERYGQQAKLTTSPFNKYNAKKTEINGVQFDSKKEAKVYQDLESLQRIGKISNLRRQVRFELVPKQKDERAVFYVADYVYEQDGKQIVADCKSAMTKKLPAYIIKRKLMKWRYPEYMFIEL